MELGILFSLYIFLCFHFLPHLFIWHISPIIMFILSHHQIPVIIPYFLPTPIQRSISGQVVSFHPYFHPSDVLFYHKEYHLFQYFIVWWINSIPFLVVKVSSHHKNTPCDKQCTSSRIFVTPTNSTPFLYPNRSTNITISL